MPSNRSHISTSDAIEYQGQRCVASHQSSFEKHRIHADAFAAQLGGESLPCDDGADPVPTQSFTCEVPGADNPLLTPQEVACLEWCKEGKTNWEIGGILRISEKTVEFHLGNVKRKLGATNRISAVVIGLRYGLISL
ncbi:helix-turn-helix domain-containing protein [Bradyrhizobium sp. IC3195]|nr:helix-turn-helix domain-containing protein [Bradyrhizobium sp. IC3195]MCA1500263.1 helix-turn-helix domain-containing protein [Bradyrhizobium sp. NBAIM14]